MRGGVERLVLKPSRAFVLVFDATKRHIVLMVFAACLSLLPSEVERCHETAENCKGCHD